VICSVIQMDVDNYSPLTKNRISLTVLLVGFC